MNGSHNSYQSTITRFDLVQTSSSTACKVWTYSLYLHRSSTKVLIKLWNIGYTSTDEAIKNIQQKTALLEYAVHEEHLFDIDRSRKSWNLPILESCHIKTTQHTVNHRTDTDNLHATYAGVFKALEKLKKY